MKKAWESERRLYFWCWLSIWVALFQSAPAKPQVCKTLLTQIAFGKEFEVTQIEGHHSKTSLGFTRYAELFEDPNALLLGFEGRSAHMYLWANRVRFDGQMLPDLYPLINDSGLINDGVFLSIQGLPQSTLQSLAQKIRDRKGRVNLTFSCVTAAFRLLREDAGIHLRKPHLLPEAMFRSLFEFGLEDDKGNPLGAKIYVTRDASIQNVYGRLQSRLRFEGMQALLALVGLGGAGLATGVAVYTILDSTSGIVSDFEEERHLLEKNIEFQDALKELQAQLPKGWTLFLSRAWTNSSRSGEIAIFKYYMRDPSNNNRNVKFIKVNYRRESGSLSIVSAHAVNELW